MKRIGETLDFLRGRSGRARNTIAVAALIGAIHLFASGPARADVIYQTGFENPPFTVGAINGQDGWTVFSGGVTPNAPSIENAVTFAGSQALGIDAVQASGQTGPIHMDVSPAGDTIVTMEGEVLLTSSSVQTAWQFGGLKSGGGFIGGFNALANGTLQLITTGFPVTGPVITRDVWNQWEVVYNFNTQTFDVLINNTLVASDVAFVSPSSTFGGGIFDTFNAAGGNDQGYLDNYSITGSSFSVPEPGSFLLLATGLPLLGAWRKKSRCTST